MKIKPIEDNNTDYSLVSLLDSGKTYNFTPHCIVHGAMNKVSIFDDEDKFGGYWRCLQAQCRAGCIEESLKSEPIKVDWDYIKESLVLIKNHINSILDSIDDENHTINFFDKESIMLYLKSNLTAECHCDDYNGFDCGCSKRRITIELAFHELNKTKTF